ncbi:hypothetical protein V8E36_002563 [Tilletia maclaganii]
MSFHSRRALPRGRINAPNLHKHACHRGIIVPHKRQDTSLGLFDMNHTILTSTISAQKMTTVRGASKLIGARTGLNLEQSALALRAPTLRTASHWGSIAQPRSASQARALAYSHPMRDQHDRPSPSDTRTGPQPPPARPTRLQASLAQVRALAERHGSDPASLVASFLVLHELTAIIPLLILFWIFDLLGAGQAFLSWLGEEEEEGHQVSDRKDGVKAVVNGWVNEGVHRAERVGRRYGLFGMDKVSKEERQQRARAEPGAGSARTAALVGSFANAVAAYACVKALIPLRLAASVALAPAFARTAIEPFKRVMTRWRGARRRNAQSPKQ